MQVAETMSISALDPHQRQHLYPGWYRAASTTVTHPGHDQDLQLAKTLQRKQLLQVDCCFLLELYFS